VEKQVGSLICFLRCPFLQFPLRRGRYCLSTRTVLELLPYLKTNYPDECNECLICYEVRAHTSLCHRRTHALIDIDARRQVLHAQLPDQASQPLLRQIPGKWAAV